MTRGPDGKFDDDALAKILLDATGEPAGSYGAQSTPARLRGVEIMGLQQARAWGVCTMNEFRKYLGLKRMCICSSWSIPSLIIEIRVYFVRGVES